ncbi:putative PAP2 superfamily [Blattamonas nauphoetae]|uniref:PAP2 superfamily n=1 Tax=Blattamonas nauphoetae TaxID=2049346 RepID=A0ABQ9YEW4_9EUKA|nr:putative PAP2 superfamily [Blattamonas nauphoetae]
MSTLHKERRKESNGITSVAYWGFMRNTFLAILPLFTCVLYFGNPVERPFSLEWEHIQKPHIERETIPTKLLCIYAFFSVFLFMIFYSFSSGHPGRTFVCTWVAFATGIAINEAITATLKTSISRFRPDFLDRCKPDMEQAQLIIDGQMKEYGHQIAASFICTGSSKAIREGRHSFPSGHASLSSWSAFFSLILLVARLYQYLNRDTIGHHLNPTLSDISSTSHEGNKESSTGSTAPLYTAPHTISLRELLLVFVFCVVAFVPLLGSVIISVSRVANNWHHPSDVFVGWIIGAISGLISGGVSIVLEDDEDLKTR